MTVSESEASVDELVEPGPMAKPTNKKKRLNVLNKLVEKAQELENSKNISEKDSITAKQPTSSALQREKSQSRQRAESQSMTI